MVSKCDEKTICIGVVRNWVLSLTDEKTAMSTDVDQCRMDVDRCRMDVEMAYRCRLAFSAPRSASSDLAIFLLAHWVPRVGAP